MMISLNVEKRDKNNNKELRKKGLIPAVFYGKKQNSTPVAVSLSDFERVWKEVGESSVLTLKGPDGEKEAIIKDVDRDPVTGIPRHADFHVFEEGHKIEVNVPLEFIGTSPAVKEMGGVLVKVMHELAVKAMPKSLPHEIKVDISDLNDFESQINAGDIKLPEGVELMEDPEEAVALVSEPKEEEEEEEEPADISQVEVEKKGKKEDEESEGTDSDSTSGQSSFPAQQTKEN